MKNIKKAIINTDTDGLLSGLLLHHFCGTEIVGFCDSGEYVWKREGVDWGDCTFIDMYVVPEKIQTFCNHMIAVDEPHATSLFWNKNKMNPNVDESARFFLGSYARKFSLATVHYLLAWLENYGYDVCASLNLRNTHEGFRCIDVLLRADDVANNTLHSYRENSLFWWGKMKEIASNRNGESRCISSLINYLEAIHNEEIRMDTLRFKKIFGNWVKNRFGCDSPDGGFKGLNFANCELGEQAKNYISFLSDITTLSSFPLEGEFVCYRGTANRVELSMEDLEDIKKGVYRNTPLFSYAFVSMPSSPRHFSYTVNLERV